MYHPPMNLKSWQLKKMKKLIRNRIKSSMESEGGFKAEFLLIRRSGEYEVSIDCPSEKWMYAAYGKTLEEALDRFKAEVLQIEREGTNTNIAED